MFILCKQILCFMIGVNMKKEEMITVPKSEIQKLIRLTFDEDPEVRKSTARKLAKIDDPAAVFALVELSTDKDDGVKELAKKLIAERPPEEGAESIEEMFTKPKQTEISEKKVRERIDRLFKGVDERKAKRIKEKIVPLFMQKILVNKRRSSESKKAIRLSEEPEEKKAKQLKLVKEEMEKATKQVDNVLTTYLSALDDIEPMFGEEKKIKTKQDKEKANIIEEEVEKIKEPEPEFIYEQSKSFLPFFYFMLEKAKHFGEKEIEKESKRILKNIEKDLKLASQMAIEKKRGKKINNIADLIKIKTTKRSINIDFLEVISIESFELKKGRRYQEVKTITLKQGENQILAVIPKERCDGLKIGDKLKLEKAIYKNFPEFSCFALTVTKTGKVFIQK